MKANKTTMVRVVRAHGLVYVSFTTPTIDEANFVTIVDDLEDIVRCPNPQYIVIDLTGVDYVDSMGLVVIQSLRESIKEVGGTAILRGPTDQIERAAEENRLACKTNRLVTSNRTAALTRW